MTLIIPKPDKMLDLLANSIKAASILDAIIKDIQMGYHKKSCTGMIEGDLKYDLQILTYVYVTGVDITTAFNNVGIQLKSAEKTKEGSGNFHVWILSTDIPRDPVYCPKQNKII